MLSANDPGLLDRPVDIRDAAARRIVRCPDGTEAVMVFLAPKGRMVKVRDSSGRYRRWPVDQLVPTGRVSLRAEA